jgi:hypothetical protein
MSYKTFLNNLQEQGALPTSLTLTRLERKSLTMEPLLKGKDKYNLPLVQFTSVY